MDADTADWTVTVYGVAAGDVTDLADWTVAVYGAGGTFAAGGGGTGPPVAGYLAWWDATTITGVADGAPLTAWPDLTSSHYDLAQAAPANQPVYYSSTAGQLVNGHPTVRANGNQFMSTSAGLAQAAPFTVVAVLTCASLAANRTLFASNAGNDQLVADTTGTWFLFGPGGPWTTTLHMDTTGPHLIAAQFTGNPSSLTQDATTQTGGTPGAVALASTFFWLAGNGGGQPWAGNCCEGGVYPFALTGPQLASLRSYAQAKWGTP